MLHIQHLTTGPEFKKLRQQVHNGLIDSIELDGSVMLTDHGEIRERIRWLIDELIETTGEALGDDERIRIEWEIIEEIDGMGPLAPLMMDAEISDILVNGPAEVWIDKLGQLSRTDVCFDDEAHLRRFIDRIADAQGRTLDARSPMVDVKLKDGSRVHAVIPPLCVSGPVVSIRRFRVEMPTHEELFETGFVSKPMLEFLGLVVGAGLNVVISGGAGSGKTTLLNLLSSYIPRGERLVTIEETAELRLDHPHVVGMESRPANHEHLGGVSLRDLVRTALRMRADRIIVGEVRGPEVWDMLQAMNVGHDGSLTTVHANTPRDVLRRLEALAQMADVGFSGETIKEMIASSVNLVVQLCRFGDGSRRVVSICEVVERGRRLETRELFCFRADTESDGRVCGQHLCVEPVPETLARLQQRGIDVSTWQRAFVIHAGAAP